MENSQLFGSMVIPQLSRYLLCFWFLVKLQAYAFNFNLERKYISFFVSNHFIVLIFQKGEVYSKSLENFL